MLKLRKARASASYLKLKFIALSNFTGLRTHAFSVSAEDSGGPNGHGFGVSLSCFSSGRLYQEHREAKLREGTPVQADGHSLRLREEESNRRRFGKDQRQAHLHPWVAR